MTSEQTPQPPLVKKRGNPLWVKGFTPPPRTNPKATYEQIWQDPGPRAKKLIEKHGIQEVMKAADDIKYAAKHFSSYDQMILAAIANAMKGNGEERERLFNRMFGKVPERTINLNVNVDIDPTKLTDRARDMLARIETSD